MNGLPDISLGEYMDKFVLNNGIPEKITRLDFRGAYLGYENVYQIKSGIIYNLQHKFEIPTLNRFINSYLFFQQIAKRIIFPP